MAGAGGADVGAANVAEDEPGTLLGCEEPLRSGIAAAASFSSTTGRLRRLPSSFVIGTLPQVPAALEKLVGSSSRPFSGSSGPADAMPTRLMPGWRASSSVPKSAN